MRDLTDVTTALYRLRDDDQKLLYVGIAVDPLTRWMQHARDKEWWALVSHFSVEWHSSRELAEAAELMAIRTEDPEFNRAGVLGLKPDRPGLATVISETDRHKVPRRQIALSDTAWALLGELHGDRGRSEIIRSLVAWHLREPGAKLPVRPSAVEISSARARVQAAALAS